jgi:hypothetical protein
LPYLRTHNLVFKSVQDAQLDISNAAICFSVFIQLPAVLLARRRFSFDISTTLTMHSPKDHSHSASNISPRPLRLWESFLLNADMLTTISEPQEADTMTSKSAPVVLDTLTDEDENDTVRNSNEESKLSANCHHRSSSFLITQLKPSCTTSSSTSIGRRRSLACKQLPSSLSNEQRQSLLMASPVRIKIRWKQKQPDSKTERSNSRAIL